jgi:hypothetical protein
MPVVFPQSALLELAKGMAAWTVMQETACDADTALAAIQRQFSGNATIEARDVMDRMSAACLDIVSRDE